MVCICFSSRPPASGTTAAGFPRKGLLVKASIRSSLGMVTGNSLSRRLPGADVELIAPDSEGVVEPRSIVFESDAGGQFDDLVVVEVLLHSGEQFVGNVH